MSNHIDPKMQEIIARSEKDQKHLEMFMTESIKSRIRDIAYLLSEYKRLTEALEKIRDYDVAEEYNHVDEWAEAGAFGEVQKIAAAALSHLKGE